MQVNYLPIGTVVSLKGGENVRVMVIGYAQMGENEPDKIYDYASVVYPQGYTQPDRLFLFDNGDVDHVFAMGHMDDQQFLFGQQLDKAMKEVGAFLKVETRRILLTTQSKAPVPDEDLQLVP